MGEWCLPSLEVQEFEGSTAAHLKEDEIMATFAREITSACVTAASTYWMWTG
jgi:hypothetical protein